MNKIKELMHDQKKRLLSTVHSYIGKGAEHASRQSASWFFIALCPIAEKLMCRAVILLPLLCSLYTLKVKSK
jgi:hypothetical protein